MSLESAILTLVIPIACVLTLVVAITITCLYHRRTDTKIQDLEQNVVKDVAELNLPRDDVKTRLPEAPGDTVTVYVELEVDDKADRQKRARVYELDGRCLGDAKSV
jgi:hypothetical protein